MPDASGTSTLAPPPPTESQRLAYLEEYTRRLPQYERVLKQLLTLLEEYRRIQYDDTKVRVHFVRGRVKTAASLAEKARRTGLSCGEEEIFSRITDIVGVRIVCNTLEGKAAACRWLEGLEQSSPKLFTIQDARNVEYKTGYRSHHYLVRLHQSSWPTLWLDQGDDDERVTVEVQVRTILEEAWGEIEHDLLYKSADRCGLKGHDGAVLRSGFVALSHRLHDADILVQRLTRRITHEPPRLRAARVAEQHRSLSIDTTKLALPDASHAEALSKALGAAERERLAGRHDEAYALHEQLRRDERFVSSRVQRVLLSEMALDRVMQAGTELDEHRNLVRVAGLLGEAWELYEVAHQADPDGNAAILFWRQSRIRALQGKHSEAGELLRKALYALETLNKPNYISAPFYKAAIKTRIGMNALFEYEAMANDEDRKDGAGKPLLATAESHLRQAVSDQRDVGPSSPGVVAPREWMLDFLDSCNNFAWFHFRQEDFASAQKLIEEAREAVDPAIWEQDIHFLDTMLAVELARLAERSNLGELTRIDSLRIRILNILSLPGTYVDQETRASMLTRISEFERRWHELVLTGVIDAG